jgi:hypothetical protein
LLRGESWWLKKVAAVLVHWLLFNCLIFEDNLMVVRGRGIIVTNERGGLQQQLRTWEPSWCLLEENNK